MKLLRQLGTMLMTLLMAIALWWYATDKRTTQVSDLRVPIRVIVPEDLIIVEQSASHVSVTLRGPRGGVERILHRTKLREIEAMVDLTPDTAAVQGQKQFSQPLSADDIVGLPPDTMIIQLRPDRVNVTVVRRVGKRLRVEATLTGKPAAGYQIVGRPYIQPRKVLVRGPKTLLDAAEVIHTKPIDIAGVTEETNRTFPWPVAVRQELTDAQGATVHVQCDEQVWVYLTVGRVLDKRTIANVPVRILTTPDYAFRVKLKDEHVSLALSGPKHVLDKLQPADIVAYVNVADLRPATAPYKQPLVCTLPEDVHLDQQAPTVDVDVSLPKPKGQTP